MSENTSRKRQILKDTVDHLTFHRQVVYGLREAIKATKATIETILPHIKECNMCTDEVDSGGPKTDVDMGSCKTCGDHRAPKTCVGPGASKTYVDPVARKTCIGFLKQSLQNMSSSIFYHSETLVNSFDRLNKHIHYNVLDIIRETDKSMFPSRKSESLTQTILSFLAMEKGDNLDMSDIKREKTEQVESSTQTILNLLAMEKGDNLDMSVIKQEKTEQVESSTQAILSFMSMEKGDFLDISDIKQEKVEQVVVERNQLWAKSLQFEEQLKKEKEISAAYQTEVRQLKEQLKELQNKNEKDLQKTVDQNTLEVNKSNARIKELQNELKEQHNKSENLQKSITKYESEAMKMNETIRQLQRELNGLKERSKRSDNDLRAEIACQESELNQLTSENHQLKDQLQKMREESEKTLQETYRGHEIKVSQLNFRIQQLQEEFQVEKKKKENLVQQVNERDGKITELKNLLQVEGEKNEKSMQEYARKHDVEVRQLNKKIAGLEQLKLEEAERKQEHKKEIEAMKQSSEVERRKLEEQLNSFHQQARKRPIQLSYLGKGDLMPKVLEELKMSLVDKLGITRHELQFVTCLKESDVDPDIPLLALCINVSRLGTDASTTMQNIKASKNVLLVILHHKDVHALPSQTSDRVLTGPEFHNLAGIYDIGFLADKGIYSCNMNKTAIDGILEFITRTHKNNGTLNYNKTIVHHT